MSYDPRKLGAKCSRCPRKGQTPVPPEGPKRAHLCWLGQDPGKNEVKQGRPFVGATGVRLGGLWEAGSEANKVSLPRKFIWVTNVSLCLPVTKGAAEAKRAADCCAPRLRKELLGLHSDAGILSMGRWAFYALTGLTKGIGKFSGFFKKLKRLPPVPEVKVKKAKKSKPKKETTT